MFEHQKASECKRFPGSIVIFQLITFSDPVTLHTKWLPVTVVTGLT